MGRPAKIQSKAQGESMVLLGGLYNNPGTCKSVSPYCFSYTCALNKLCWGRVTQEISGGKVHKVTFHALLASVFMPCVMCRLTPVLFSSLVLNSVENCCGLQKEEELELLKVKCQLYFEMLPHQFSGDRVKIAFIISLLSGKARHWAESMWTSGSLAMQSLDPFLVHFKNVFGISTSALSVPDELFSLWQANRAIHDYSLHFRTLAASSGWNEVALLSAYRRGLNSKIQQQMAIYDDSIGLELFMFKAQHISQHLFAVSIEEGTPSDTSSSCSSSAPEPMQTDQYCLLANERQCRLHQRLCLYCGENDHLLQTCPARPPRPTSSLTLGHLGTSSPHVCCPPARYPAKETPTCYRITTIQGKPLGKGLVQWKMPELTLRIGCLHEEMLSLLVLEESEANLPGEYQDYQDVFSQMAAMKLPPHRSWNCAIDLLPGAKLPKERVYPLSILENKPMEEYISEALQQGFIQPSTSPAASSFFFLAKKDGGLRSCIDYRVLNSQMVKFAYLLPLVPAALEELCRAQLFSKLDLCSAYNLIRI
ncbi:hypothetical protein QTP86_007483 [Hemibagrus guttatus]|nr:hypothetical protein QTP86_007483 [Hemibagrus guttatus]